MQGAGLVPGLHNGSAMKKIVGSNSQGREERSQEVILQS